MAAGALVLEEAGGVVTDTNGHPLDFRHGAKLQSIGILGAIDRPLHQTLLEAYRQQP